MEHLAPFLVMKELIYVFLGGGTGSIFRYLLSTHISFFSMKGFPVGTLLCNVLGCCIIGFGFSLFREHPGMKLLLLTGFCGGLTTFSTFSSENIQFLENQQYTMAFSYTVLSIGLGFFATFLGFSLAKN